MDIKQQIILEYTKCASDPAYGIQNYLETFDKTQNSFVPFTLFRGQKELLKNLMEHRFNVIRKYRQAGISTVVSGYSAMRMGFGDEKNPEKILILANKQDTSIEFLAKIIDFLKQLPDWVGVEFVKESSKHIKLSNGAEAKAVATSRDALRGFTPTILVLDEAAFIEGGQELWSACLASIGTGGKAVLISTPNGLDEIYYAAYDGSLNGHNSFKITDLKWYDDPRYNKELYVVKVDDIVEWLQKPDEEKEQAHRMVVKPSDVPKYLEQGYKPCSPWYENMARDMHFNKRMIAQELEGAFNGSGDNVIDPLIIEKQNAENVKQPFYKDLSWNNDMWIWEMPKPNHKYILAIDVSRGDSEDYTGMVIIDYDAWEEVAEYMGKIPPDDAANLVYHYGRMYNALSTIDITGGMGVATAKKLEEMNYSKKLLHYDGLKESDLYMGPPAGAIPGINFAARNNRGLIVQALEEGVRQGFKVRSERMTSEMLKFVYRNGRPDHMKGAHDDLLMSLGMALHVANTSFKRLEENTNQIKAMLNSWRVNENKMERPSSTLAPKDSIYNSNHIDNKNNLDQIPGNYRHGAQEYLDNSWLFGKFKR